MLVNTFMEHRCQFPGCTYTTSSRSKIDHHHIIPREIDPKSKRTIPLCKTHHAMIYIPESKDGQHAIKCDESIIIHGEYQSTMGKSYLMENMTGDKFYYFPETMSKWNA